MTITADQKKAAIESLKESQKALAAVTRYTPFDKWGQGEHGAAQRAVIKAAVTAAKALATSSNPADQKLASKLQEYAQGVRRGDTPNIADSIKAYEHYVEQSGGMTQQPSSTGKADPERGRRLHAFADPATRQPKAGARPPAWSSAQARHAQRTGAGAGAPGEGAD